VQGEDRIFYKTSHERGRWENRARSTRKTGGVRQGEKKRKRRKNPQGLLKINKAGPTPRRDFIIIGGRGRGGHPGRKPPPPTPESSDRETRRCRAHGRKREKRRKRNHGNLQKTCSPQKPGLDRSRFSILPVRFKEKTRTRAKKRLLPRAMQGRDANDRGQSVNDSLLNLLTGDRHKKLRNNKRNGHASGKKPGIQEEKKNKRENSDRRQKGVLG